MAKIPEYQTQYDRQNVELGAPKQALNIPQAALGSDGEALQDAGKGLQNAGAVLAAVRTRMNEEKATADANKALSKEIDDTSPYMAFVASSKGEDAIGITQGTREHLQGVANDIGGTLSDGARKIFDQAVAAHIREKVAAAATHEATQLQEYRYTAADSLAVKEAQNALTNFNNAELFNSGLARAVEKKQEALAVKGLGADSAQAQQAIAAFQSTAVRERAQTYLNRGAYGTAKDIAVNDTRLLPEDREDLDKAIRPLATLGKAQEVYDSLKGLGERAIKVIEADKTLDPDVRQKALELVDHNVSRQREAIQFNQHQTAMRLAGEVETAVRKGDVAGAMRIRDTAPVWARPGLSEVLDRFSRRKSGPQDEGGPAGLVWDLRRKAAENPAAFLDDWSKNRASYAARLSTHSQAFFDNLFMASHKGDSKPMEELLSDQDLLKNTAKQLGINTGRGAGAADAQKMGSLEREYTRAVEDATRAKGGKLSTSEKQAVIDKQILMPGTVQGMLGRWKATKFGAKLSGDTTFQPTQPLRPTKNIPGLYFNHAANAWGVEDSSGRFRPYLGGK